MDRTVLLAALIGAYLIVTTIRDDGGFDGMGDPEDQTGSMLDQLPGVNDLTNMVSDMTNPIDGSTAAANVAAFLAVLRQAEGTASDEGYRALFGWRPGNGKTFSNYATHPRQFFNYTDHAGKTIRTSAAGAYQITATTFDGLARSYGYSDFYPATQDAMAVSLIAEKGALVDIQAGRFDIALNKVRKIWASLPGSGSNQPERSIDYVKTAYLQAGGTLA